MTGDDRRRILELVAAGDIDIDEADELLAGVGGSESELAAKRSSTAPPKGSRRRRRIRSDVVFDLAVHGVSPDWIRALREAGLDGLSPDVLIDLADHGVSPFAR